jgi:hypothetical protein
LSYEIHAPQLVELGYDPTPCHGKDAFLPGWPERPKAALQFEQHKGCSIGIVLGGPKNVIALDIDVPFEPAASIIKDYIVDNLPAMPERIGKAPKRLYLCRSENPRKKARSKVFNEIDGNTGEILCDPDGKEIKIDIELLANGQQFIASGIHPDTKKKYIWPGDSILDYPADELPVVSDAEIDALIKFSEGVFEKYFIPTTSKSEKSSSGHKLNLFDGSNPPLGQIAEALTYLSADDYDDFWIRFGLALRNSYGSTDDVFEVWRTWSETSKQYDDTGKNSCAAKWATFKDPSKGVRAVTVASIIDEAKKAGWSGPTLASDTVDEINQDYAVILVGGRLAILREFLDEEGQPTNQFLSVDGFKQWMGNRFTKVGKKDVPLAAQWMQSPGRRQYSGLVFAPSGAPEDYYNLWKGFGIGADNSGSCQLFLDHVLENICANDGTLFSWVMGWFAHIVQHPDDKLGTSLVLRGKQGTGKTVVGSVFGKLFGQHYVQVADPRYIVGQFNSHLSSCLLLHCDEGFWAGDKGAEGKLKDLVTGGHQLIEFKGKEPIRVRNLVRLLITSNHGWVVPAGFEERRFCVLDAGEAHMQDHDYFAAIFDELDNGGYEALLYGLQNLDLSKVNLRKVPDTVALAEQKYETMTPEQSWWFECLRNGVVCEPDEAWRSVVGCNEAFDSYVAHAGKLGIRRRAAQVVLGTALKKLAPGCNRSRRSFDKLVPTDTGGWEKEPTREYAYFFPSLEVCRTAFDKLLGVETNWESDDV